MDTTPPNSTKLDQLVRNNIKLIRAELKETAAELSELKRLRSRFTKRDGERYCVLCRRATVLHVALRFNRMSLGRRSVAEHPWHLYSLRLDGPWFGAVHDPTPATWRPKLRPNRRVASQAVKVPETQPHVVSFNISRSVNWTRMVNDWAIHSGTKPFQLDMIIYSFISEHIQQRLAEKAQRKAAADAIRGPGAIIN